MSATMKANMNANLQACAAVLALSVLLFLPRASDAQDSFGGTAPAPAARRPAPEPMQPKQPAPGVAAPAPKPGSGIDAELARMEAMERQDMGVPPTAQLHAGAMHGPTPTSLPGGRLVTTREIHDMVRRSQGDRATAPRVFDILGGQERLPGALLALPAAQPGSFDDATQREFGNFLQGVTQGRRDLPMIFYCASTQCWLSYNAALRAVRLGYTNVLWYRGGLEAWKRAGLPLQTADGGQAAAGPKGGAAAPAR
jgi:PQQ-dependent catabolism-associated CXXCW motif protein